MMGLCRMGLVWMAMLAAAGGSVPAGPQGDVAAAKAAGSVAAQGEAPASPDERLAAARQFVEKSERYLHHGKLRRGMEGYGLTVLAGTEIVRFRARVVSVVERWNPHQDVILAELGGQRLEHTGIIAGMSGSPVYFKDPADDKYKLVGAVAYGWRGSKDALCGIQPVTQMIAASGWYRPKPAAAAAEAGQEGGEEEVVSAPAADEALRAAVLDPRKIDFSELCLPASARRQAGQVEPSGPSLVPLATPLMVSASTPRMLAEMARRLEPLGIVPVASGGPGAVEAQAARNVKLEPGAAIAVPLVTGDADWSAIGTVTDVVDGRVMAFGHSFFGVGDVKVPIGTAYVHTCVAGLFGSFKMAAGLEVAGTLLRDEEVAVSGVIGPKPRMVPLTLRIHWTADKRTEEYRFQIADHREMMPSLARMMAASSALAWRAFPEQHVVRHSVLVDFDKFGTYRAANISCNDEIGPALSDLTRPMAAMLTNPYGQRATPKRMEVELTVESGNPTASLVDLTLAGSVYRPGETVVGELVVRPFRKDRQKLELRFDLPQDLPEGEYSLTVCDVGRRMGLEQAEMPHRFAPRSTQELWKTVQYVVQPSAAELYLHMLLPAGGLALGMRELPDLPDSKAQILSQASIPDTKAFRKSLVRTMKTDYLMQGSLSAGFRVRRQPGETLLRDQ